MKIDPSISTSDLGITSQGNAKDATSTSQVQTAVEDTTKLAFDRTTNGTLTSQAMAVTDVRQDKVDALREAINSGQYKVQPDEIAEAMLQNAPEL